MSEQATALDPLDALAAQHGAVVLSSADELDALAAQHGAVGDEASPTSSSALWLQGASKAIPLAEHTTKAALNAPNAPRIIQRAIGAAVRGASTAVGASIGGVPGAVGGAAMSEGLTPTQQTIRGWLGRTATSAATASPSTADAVVNYIESMGADANNLTGAALEYAKKAGRAILYDAYGRASLVPAQSVVHPPPTPTAMSPSSSALGNVARVLSILSAVQGGLDISQMAEPDRKDIGFLGMGATKDIPKDKLDAIYADAVANGIKSGLTPSASAARLADGDVQKFSAAMAAYMKSRQVK